MFEFLAALGGAVLLTIIIVAVILAMFAFENFIEKNEGHTKSNIDLTNHQRQSVIALTVLDGTRNLQDVIDLTGIWQIIGFVLMQNQERRWSK